MKPLVKVLIKICFRCILFLSAFVPIGLFAQNSYESLNHTLRSFNAFPNSQYRDTNARESTFQPNLNTDLFGDNGTPYRSYAPSDAYDESILLNKKYRPYSWFRRKLMFENFIIIDTGILYITIDPLLNVSAGSESYSRINRQNQQEDDNKSLYTNTRGLLLKADIGKKFSMESYFYENQASLPTYVEDFVEFRDVVPGQGRVKDFKESDVDFAQSGGYFNYSPWKAFNVQFGHHKHFIGSGYRSFILSDNSFNYPFLRLNYWSRNNKLSYSFMMTSFQDLQRSDTLQFSEAPFVRKGGTYHVLEYRFSKRFKMSLIQGMIYKTHNADGSSNVSYSMFNPILGANAIIDGLDAEDNAFVALGLNVLPFDKLEVYAQALLDDEKFERTAFQLGLNIYPVNHFYVQLEGNFASEDVFDYNSESGDYFNGFVHYNQVLGHTLGNDFNEIIFRTAYRYKRLIPEFQVNYSERAKSNSNAATKNLYYKLELAYLLNPATNLKVYLSYAMRDQNHINYDRHQTSSMVYFGIKTDLRNIYYDF